MASKLVMVPESLYKGLLSSNEYNDRTNIEHTKSKLEGVKKSRKLNASAKNVLYNQELRRYLSMREDEKNKPVKVEVTNGGKFLTKPNRRRRTVLGFDDDGELNDLTRGHSTPRSAVSLDQGFFHGDPAAPPAPDAPQRDGIGTPEAMHLTEEEHEFFQYIRDNGARFGVTAEGRVIASMAPRRYVQNADLHAIVRALKNPAGYPRKPPGYKQILDRGKHDAMFRIHADLTPPPNPRELVTRNVTTRRIKVEKFSPDIWRTPR